MRSAGKRGDTEVVVHSARQIQQCNALIDMPWVEHTSRSICQGMNPYDLVIRVNSSGLGSLSVAKLSHRITAARFIDAPIRFDSLIFYKIPFFRTLFLSLFQAGDLVVWYHVPVTR